MERYKLKLITTELNKKIRTTIWFNNFTEIKRRIWKDYLSEKADVWGVSTEDNRLFFETRFTRITYFLLAESVAKDVMNELLAAKIDCQNTNDVIHNMFLKWVDESGKYVLRKGVEMYTTASIEGLKRMIQNLNYRVFPGIVNPRIITLLPLTVSEDEFFCYLKTEEESSTSTLVNYR